MWSLSLVGVSLAGGEMAQTTDRPIIGILAQETSEIINKEFPGYSSYISAAYVKAVEASGARPVPVFINRTAEYYRSVARSINGLLLPGGNTWFFNPNGYADAGAVLYDEVKELNKDGVHFPILAICLGFELLLLLDNNKTEYRVSCSAKNVALNLDFRPGYRDSQLFSKASQDIIDILSTQPVTLNQHQFCVTEKKMMDFNLTEKWKILSVNSDSTGVEFVSTIESKKYPFVGLQFHPDKVFEWRKDLKNPHSYNSILASRFFFDWLVNQARLNTNHFATIEDENNHLIFNYPKTFTRGKLIYDEMYLFSDDQELSVHAPSGLSNGSSASLLNSSMIFGVVLLPLLICWRLFPSLLIFN